MPKRTDKLTELVLRKIETFRVQHGQPGQPMKQKTLARRSGQSYARVHKFIAGQMPYPPLDFLNALLMSFGTTLADVLKGETAAPAQLPIVRSDVQRVANMLDDGSPELVEQVEGWLSLFLRGQAAGESKTAPARLLPVAKAKGVGAKRGPRGTRRG